MNILPAEQVVENTACLNNDIGFIAYPLKKCLKMYSTYHTICTVSYLFFFGGG